MLDGRGRKYRLGGKIYSIGKVRTSLVRECKIGWWSLDLVADWLTVEYANIFFSSCHNLTKILGGKSDQDK
jgi:hypothetical protein